MKQKETLCQSCENFENAKFENGKEYRYCTAMAKPQAYLKSLAVECNQYHCKTSQSIDDMKRIAWVIENKPGVGFTINRPDGKNDNTRTKVFV